MNRLTTVRLVAWREITTRMRSKAYRISTALVSLAVAAMIVAPRLFADDDPTTLTIAVVDDGQVEEFTNGAALAGGQLDVEVEVETIDADEVETAIVDGDADVSVDGTRALWHEEVSQFEATIIRAGLQSAATVQRSEDLGISLRDVGTLLAPVDLETATIEPEDSDREEKIVTASIGTILLFMAIQFHGTAVLSGVIEEKSSRVVEILLTHIRASQLLAGKILGIGTVGLTQGAIIAVVAVGTSSAVSGADVPDLQWLYVLSLLGWFVLGFVQYATAYATAGSLVSRQEDAQAAVTPLAIPFVAAYILSIGIADNPDGTVGRVASVFPLTAPLSMPVRMAAGNPAAVEIVVAVVLTVLTTYGLIRLGGRIYQRNLLRTGTRVPWTQALRGLRAATPTD